MYYEERSLVLVKLIGCQCPSSLVARHVRSKTYLNTMAVIGGTHQPFCLTDQKEKKNIVLYHIFTLSCYQFTLAWRQTARLKSGRHCGLFVLPCGGVQEEFLPFLAKNNNLLNSSIFKTIPHSNVFCLPLPCSGSQ